VREKEKGEKEKQRLSTCDYRRSPKLLGIVRLRYNEYNCLIFINIKLFEKNSN